MDERIREVGRIASSGTGSRATGQELAPRCCRSRAQRGDAQKCSCTTVSIRNLTLPSSGHATAGFAWAQVIERGYEGYVAKDETSVYEPGPTRRWLKVK